jgi:hypothetical protein
LVWYWGLVGALRFVERTRHGRARDFWLSLVARSVVLMLLPGIGALIFGRLFLRVVYDPVMGGG